MREHNWCVLCYCSCSMYKSHGLDSKAMGLGAQRQGFKDYRVSLSVLPFCEIGIEDTWPSTASWLLNWQWKAMYPQTWFRKTAIKKVRFFRTPCSCSLITCYVILKSQYLVAGISKRFFPKYESMGNPPLKALVVAIPKVLYSLWSTLWLFTLQPSQMQALDEPWRYVCNLI